MLCSYVVLRGFLSPINNLLHAFLCLFLMKFIVLAATPDNPLILFLYNLLFFSCIHYLYSYNIFHEISVTFVLIIIMCLFTFLYTYYIPRAFIHLFVLFYVLFCLIFEQTLYFSIFLFFISLNPLKYLSSLQLQTAYCLYNGFLLISVYSLFLFF